MSKQLPKNPICVHNMFIACNFHVLTGNSMNNLPSYCRSVDARISASEKDLPVPLMILLKVHIFREGHKILQNLGLTFDYST